MMKNKILAAVMKKLYLLCVIICLLPACKKSEEFNIDNIKAPKDYVLFEKADNKLDVENAGTNKYKSLSIKQRDLLSKQYNIMIDYIKILEERLNNLKE